MAAFKNKDNGTWYIQFRYTDWRGERQQKLKRGFITKKEAQAWEREFLMEKQADVITINTIAVENEVADNMYQRSEMDWLIYNAPLDYADLVLNGNPEKYLKAVAEYKSLDS